MKEEQIKRLKRKKGKRSIADRPNQRWATDIYCGRDGWAHLVVVIDCHDREGWESFLKISSLASVNFIREVKRND